MHTLKILKKASSLVCDGWCKCSGAKDENYDVVATLSPQARHFCTVGAIFRATKELGLSSDGDSSTAIPNVAISAINHFQIVNDIKNVINWNDDLSRTKSEVIDAFIVAVAAAESEEPVIANLEAIGCG